MASGFGADVEVFDAGEERAGGDVGAVGEDGHAQYTLFGPGDEYLHVSGIDGFVHSFGEVFGDWLAASEGLFEERQGFGEVGRGDDLDRVQRSMALAVILAAASTAISISLSPTSRWVHRRM